MPTSFLRILISTSTVIVCSAVELCAAQLAISPQPPSTFRCYSYPTQIGTAAVREFLDTHGLVVKRIYYVSLEPWPTTGAPPPSCPEEKLRVQSTHMYERDPSGRVIAEYLDGGNVWRSEYTGDQETPSRRVRYDREGKRLREERYNGRRQETTLGFDRKGRLVALTGKLPPDVLGFEWGDQLQGWRCGIAVTDIAEGDAGPFLYVHLLNVSSITRSGGFVSAVETDLRGSGGIALTLAEKYRSTAAPTWTVGGGIRALVNPGEADHRFAIDLHERYGTLPLGTYSITVRHPHPETGTPMVSNTATFEVERRPPSPSPPRFNDLLVR